MGSAAFAADAVSAIISESGVVVGALARGGGVRATAAVSFAFAGVGAGVGAGAGERAGFGATLVAAFDAGDCAAGDAAGGLRGAGGGVAVTADTGVDVSAGGERSDMGGMRSSAPPPPNVLCLERGQLSSAS